MRKPDTESPDTLAAVTRDEFNRLRDHQRNNIWTHVTQARHPAGIENSGTKVDWKEWLPIAGVVFAAKDYYTDKPSIVNDYLETIRSRIYVGYQALTSCAVITGGVYGVMYVLDCVTKPFK